ncbi:4'-phosphopantetheinyl transferase family protein [Streptomyces tailanensis]|uniref:4'-phosphopantetheinyl transferase family protein n=1 Tax=Streptomyces tailanensis TaxID=2569858 RepID=UPI00122E4953|nr:4'-phosphopantetheinyl transferase superfamily protein [Streptomyces tailanensis]
MEHADSPADDRTGLTPQDLAGAEHLPAWRAREHLAARRALRRLLAAHFPEARHAPVTYTDRGGPRLLGRPRIGISVSHDGDAVAACAALDHAVGVDLQHPPDIVSDALLRRCAQGHAEQLALLPMGPRASEFAWLWTVREAIVKAEGTGLAGDLWSADVTPYARRGAWGRHRWVSLRDQSPIPLSCAYTALPAPTSRPKAPGDQSE